MNTLNMGGKVYPLINNPTLYSPDAIVGRYIAEENRKAGAGSCLDSFVQLFGYSLATTAKAEYDKEKANARARGVLPANIKREAAQALFVRAVRTVEHEQNRKTLIRCAIFYAVCEIMFAGVKFDRSINPIDILAAWVLAIALNACYRNLIAQIIFNTFTAITDRIGINVQYSI